MVGTGRYLSKESGCNDYLSITYSESGQANRIVWVDSYKHLGRLFSP